MEYKDEIVAYFSVFEDVTKQICFASNLSAPLLSKMGLCPNLMNLSRVSNPPKTGFHLVRAGLNLEKLNTILMWNNHLIRG